MAHQRTTIAPRGALKDRVATLSDMCLPPVTKLGPPRFTLPTGATDTHFHLFGSRSAKTLVRERDYTPPGASAAAARRMFDTFGISRVVVIQPSVHGADNRDQLEEAARIGLPFRAIVVVPADATEAEMDRLHEGGARGIRYILAHPGGLDPMGLERSADRAFERGWNLQLLVKPQQLLELEGRLARLRCPFVIDHLGFVDPAGPLTQPGFAALLRLIESGNGWTKLSGAYRSSTRRPAYEDLKPFARAVLDTRPDRVVWGSDWPHVGLRDGMPNTTDLLDTFADWIPDEGERRRVLEDNPAVLFDW